jgi:hypothetical protein
LKAAFKDAPAEWEVVDVDSPSGNPIQWRKIRIEAEQSFHYTDNNKPVVGNLPGMFELWMCDKDNYTVLLGWRVPTVVQGPSTEPIPTSLQALLTSPKGNLKLDLATMPALTAGTITIDPQALADKG